MKTLTTYALAILIALSLFAGSASAQTAATSTTLSSAVTNSATTIVVASATGFTVGNYLYVIGSNEAMRIRVISGTTITVLRGQLGTAARAHPSSAVVVTGSVRHFQNIDPDFNGVCALGSPTPGLNADFQPWINVFTGTVWHCTLAGAWAGTQRANVTFNSVTLTR